MTTASLDAERWRIVSELLDHALELDAAAREAWLAGLRGGEADLVPVLRDMLARSERVERERFLEASPDFVVDAAAADSEFAPGSVIGPYRLLRLLGRGGMGEVWLAGRADGALQRAVALKLPLVALSRGSVAERFARERDILAALEHPHIARLYDAGVSVDGQPYLALEYVDGTPIDRYADGARLSIEQRLRLFDQVLDAVAYAHANLVLHRDLKPSNILVTASGDVKLLDFGIAKLIPDGEAGATALTQLAGRVLTPDYAAPEQIAGAPLTIAADVYSLGVVLYELLTGARPYRVKRGTRAALEDAIAAADITLPSGAPITEQRAAERGTTMPRLRKQLRGDLDTILGKTLHRDPRQRYEGARALADDLARQRNGLPVLAKPDDVLYRARKFALRHRAALVVAGVIGVVLVTATIVSVEQAQVARQEARRANAVQAFMTDLFRANRSSQPDPVKARATTALELLDLGARKIDKGLDDAPAAKLSTLDLMADLYDDLEVSDRAAALRKQAVALAARLYGRDDPRVADQLLALDGSLYSGPHLGDRLATLNEAARILDATRDTSTLRARLYTRYADVYNSTDRRRALDYIQQAIAAYRGLDDPRGLSVALYTAGQIQDRLAMRQEARASLLEAIAISRRIDGPRNADLPRYLTHLAEIEHGLQLLAQAEDSFRSALAIALAINGEDHIDTLQIRMRLGKFLAETGRLTEGLEQLRAARALALRLVGPDDAFHTPPALLEYGWGLVRYGEPEQGLPDMEEAIANRRRNRPDTQFLAAMLDDAAYALVDLGRYGEAQRYVDESRRIKLQFEQPPAENFNHNIVVQTYLLLALDRPQDAQRALREFYVSPPLPGLLSLSMIELDLEKAEVGLAAGDAASARGFARRVREQIAASAGAPYMRGLHARASYDEGRAALAQGDAAAALPLLDDAARTQRELLSPGSPLLLETEIARAQALQALHRMDDARQALAAAQDVAAHHRPLAPHFARELQIATDAIASR